MLNVSRIQETQDLLKILWTRRAGGLTAEYDRKASECSTEYCGTEPGHGEWVEVSEEVHQLIHQLIHQQANVRLLLPGLVKPVGSW